MIMRRWNRVLGWATSLSLMGAACEDSAESIRVAESAPPLPSLPTAPVARVEAADTWMELLAQRPNAVLTRHDAIVIDLGHPAARKHLALTGRGHWELGHQVAGRTGGLVHGRGAALDIPLDGPYVPALHPDIDGQPGLAMAVEVRSLVRDQVMTVLWNERPLANVTMGDEWERRTFSLPQEILHTGENRVRFHFRRSTAEEARDVSAIVARVELGAIDRIRRPPRDEGPGFHSVLHAGGTQSLRLEDGTGLAFYVVPPRRSRLVLDVRGRGAVRLMASADEDHQQGRAPLVLHEEPLRTTGQQTEVDLSAWGGIPLRLELSVRGHGEGAGAQIDGMAIVARRSVPVDGRARKPRDLIVVAIEGARADAFDLGRKPPLGVFDGLVAESLVFERAYALSPAAIPSHASWWTSVAPFAHLTVRGTVVADGQITLAEAMARAGYFRVLATANSDVSEERGLLQGFDERRVLGAGVEDGSAAAVLNNLFESSLERPEHWLFYGNVNDPQAPYEPPRELLRDLTMPREGAPLAHLTHVWVGRVRMGKTIPTEPELQYVRRLYRGELQVVDRALGGFLDDLRSVGRLDDAILVVVGIHGEEFFEHGGAGHGTTLYEESLRIPLLIRAPELLAPGRVEVPVDLLDLAPTLVDLVGVAAPTGWQGESLVPTIDDPQPPPRLIVGYLGDGSRSALVGQHKYILGPGASEQYFDLNEDPRELTSRHAEGGIGLRVVRGALAWQLEFETRWRRARWGTGANFRPAFALDQGM